MADKLYRSHSGNIAVRLLLVLGGRVTEIAATLGVLQSHVSAWHHGRRPVPHKYHPRLTAMLARASEVHTQALAGLEPEQLATLRHRLIQACVEIETDRAAAVMPLACSLRHIRLALGKIRHATPPSSPHAQVLATVEHALNKALSELGAMTGTPPLALAQHREVYAIVTAGDALHTQVQKLLAYLVMTYGKGVWPSRH
jgi:DNA-binding transcriptional regulator YdaS (Cro superfamily)